MARPLALLLTVVTGFTALVYEVAWHKYLAALLGSHGEATAAVLAIFLGGLSLGYGALGRVAARCRGDRRRLLRGYGVIEAVIGLYAAAFPLLFGWCQQVSLWIPAPHPAVGFAFDTALSTLLIGPPAFLMGGTIPFLTQAFARDLEDATRIHAHVYAFNTAGAFAGALAGGFLLIPSLGLTGSIWAMAVTNIAVGLLFVVTAPPTAGPNTAITGQDNAPTEAGSGHRDAVYVAVALGSGFAFMCLQTTLNRVGALALGGSPFTFAMVVAVFVLSIALGSFAVSAFRRIPPSWIAASQWLLVLLLLLAYPWVDDAPYWAHRLRILFGSGTADFYGFHAAVFGALLVVSALPLMIGGATLPLLFHRARREMGALGRTAGRLYSWNTLGSLTGALLGGYALLFWLDLHHIYRLAVLILAIGAALLSARLLPGARTASAAAALASALALWFFPAWSPAELSVGLFRQRTELPYSHESPEAFHRNHVQNWTQREILFYDDDPVTTVTVKDIVHANGTQERSVFTSGKSDGAIPVDNLTTGLLSLVPALLAERLERAFVIGYGTGHSVGELAALDSVREVEVAEISSGVMDAAPLFEAGNRQALASPKTRVIRSDAYRALLRSRGGFDVIVSEPSNPWMTGIEMLYSREFLTAARERLAPGGVYAQWFHAYETDSATVELVLRTFLDAFGDAAVWYGWGTDFIMLGFRDGAPSDTLGRIRSRFERPDIHRQLADIYLDSFPKLIAHEILPAGAVHRGDLPGPAHTILFPHLTHRAARAFFRGGRGELPRHSSMGRGETSLLAQARRASGGLDDEFRLEVLREICNHHLTLCATLFSQWRHDAPDSPRLAQSLERARTDPQLASVLVEEDLIRLAALYAPPSRESEALFTSAAEARAVYRRHFHHGAPFHPSWQRLGEPTPIARQ